MAIAHTKRFQQISNRIAPPSHRHAAPSSDPWPWIDILDDANCKQFETSHPPVPSVVVCDHRICNDCWKDYPQSLFPNWTSAQVKKSNLAIAIENYPPNVPCIIHYVNVDDNGHFIDAGKYVATESNIKESWDRIVESRVSDNIRVRALFLEDLSGPILQMLGTRHNIEPFFFSSSLNWISSRFQNEVKHGQGDHITITLPFIRSVPISGSNSLQQVPSEKISPSSASTTTLGSFTQTSIQQIVNTHAPLVLTSSGRQLVLNLLSVHLIRKKTGSVLISHHPTKDSIPITTAQYLHERIRFAGQSVYWQSIFQNSPDPTFVLLTFIWHTLYAWDEALQVLYIHICRIEGKVVATIDFNLTQDLHIIRAHLLHYSSILEDLQKTVIFLQTTINPALESLTPEERDSSLTLLQRECGNLLAEVDRLEKERELQERRLSNVINLVYSTVNILNSKRIEEMTEISLRDSAAMKRITYLSMVFLPASLIANIFGMNVKEIVPNTTGSILHYILTVVALTVIIVWMFTAYHSKSNFQSGIAFWWRLAWPVFFVLRFFGKDPYAPAVTLM